MLRNRDRLLPLLSVCLFLLTPLALAADDKWHLAADPAPAEAKWEGLAGKSIESATGELIRPATESPIILTGHVAGSTSRDTWRLTDFTKLGTLSGRFDALPGSLAISPDGKLVALIKKKNFSNIGAELWSVDEGKKSKSLDISPTAEPVVWSGFATNTLLVTLHETDQGGSKVRTVDVSTDKPPAEISGPSKVDSRLVSISPGGRLLAVGLTEGAVVVVDLADKKLPSPVRLTVPNGFGKCIGLKFSPDGTELGGLYSANDTATQHGELAIAAWSLADGKLVVQLPDVFLGETNIALSIPQANAAPAILPFDWLPDGSALLIGKSLVDRETGHVVWKLRLPVDGQNKAPLIFLGTDYVLVSRQAAASTRLEALKLPWRDVDAALKALQSNAPAWLKPNDKLSLQFEFGGLRFQTPDQVKTALTARLQTKLKELGFEVAENQPVTLKVAYAETAGAMLEKSEGFPLPRLPRGLPGFGPRRRRMADEGPVGTGTAFVIHQDGYLLTCAHVVGAAPSVQVKIGDKTYHGRVVAKNVAADYALLKVELKNLTALPLSDSSKTELGEEVRAFGFPISGVLGESLKVTRGTLAGMVKKGTQTMFQVDASINPGNSGGPLVNDLGQVVGINSAKLVGDDIDNVGFSIPINDVKAMLQEHKVTFQTKGSAMKLTGPELIKKVTPAVAFVISTGGVDTGVPNTGSVAATRIACTLSLIVKGVAEPVWTDHILVEQHRLQVAGELTEEKARELAFELFAQRLQSLSLPYFVSKDPTPVALPVITDLSIDPQSQPVSTPRKTRRGFSN